VSNYRVRQVLALRWPGRQLRFMIALATYLPDDGLIVAVGFDELTTAAGQSKTTMKAARSDLAEAGKIAYKPGRGAGIRTVWTVLCLPDKGVRHAAPFADVKGVRSDEKKGSDPAEERVTYPAADLGEPVNGLNRQAKPSGLARAARAKGAARRGTRPAARSRSTPPAPPAPPENQDQEPSAEPVPEWRQAEEAARLSGLLRPRLADPMPMAEAIAALHATVGKAVSRQRREPAPAEREAAEAERQRQADALAELMKQNGTAPPAGPAAGSGGYQPERQRACPACHQMTSVMPGGGLRKHGPRQAPCSGSLTTAEAGKDQHREDNRS
jgi:hypothetical protein